MDLSWESQSFDVTANVSIAYIDIRVYEGFSYKMFRYSTYRYVKEDPSSFILDAEWVHWRYDAESDKTTVFVDKYLSGQTRYAWVIVHDIATSYYGLMDIYQAARVE